MYEFYQILISYISNPKVEFLSHLFLLRKYACIKIIISLLKKNSFKSFKLIFPIIILKCKINTSRISFNFF